MDEIHRLGCLWPDLLALEKHLQRIAGLHQAGDALGAARARKQAELDLMAAPPVPCPSSEMTR